MARRMSDRAGSMPPMTSTTISARVTSSSASVVNNAGSTPSAARSRPARRTAMPTISRGAPTRAAMSSACSTSRRATAPPTTPAPSRATRNGWGSLTALSTAAILPSVRAPDDDAGHAVPDGDHRWPRRVVVLAREGPAVGARARDGDEVAGADVAGEELVLDDDVAALAVLAHDAGEHRVGGGRPARQRARVVGVVEGGADVVAHPAVDRDVEALGAAVELDRFDGAHLVEGERARARDGPAGLDGDAGHGHRVGAALPLDDLGHACSEVLRRHGVVLGGVGDSEAATEVELGELDPQLARDLRVETDDAPGRHLEAGGVEDLRPDVAVQSEQAQRLGPGEDPPRGLEGVPAGQRQPELLVLVRRRDELVRVGLDPHGDTDEDRRDDTELGGNRGDALDLVEGVDDDAAHAVVEGIADLGDALVVAVQADPVAGDAGALGHGELAAGAHVEVQALVMDPARDLGAQEGLPRIEDVCATREALEHLGIRLLELPCARTEVVLVDDVCRRAEVTCQLGDAHPTDREDAVAPPPHGRRPEGRDEGVDVDRGLEPRGATIALRVQRSCFVCAHGYILSGAAAPRRVSPLRKTIRTASASSSRAPWIGAGWTPAARGRTGWSQASASAARSVTARRCWTASPACLSSRWGRSARATRRWRSATCVSSPRRAEDRRSTPAASALRMIRHTRAWASWAARTGSSGSRLPGASTISRRPSPSTRA